MSRGSFQVTSRLQPVSFVAVTLGAPGADGGSSTSVTLMVTPLEALPPAPIVYLHPSTVVGACGSII